MGGLVQSLFGGKSDNSEAMLREQQQERELSQVSQARQAQQAQDNSATTSGQLAATKVARGQRLLVSKESGGLGTTLGTA